MERNEDIEVQLWEYIDGASSEADRQRISLLIENDSTWREKFSELKSLNSAISNGLELNQPSLRFTKNVMEAVTSMHIAPATKKYINKGIIRAIASFFIITIAGFLGYALATANWQGGSSYRLPKFNMNNISSVLNSNVFNLIIAVNIVLALALADTALRKKRKLS